MLFKIKLHKTRPKKKYMHQEPKIKLNTFQKVKNNYKYAKIRNIQLHFWLCRDMKQICKVK